jgi:hypothetical protein
VRDDFFEFFVERSEARLRLLHHGGGGSSGDRLTLLSGSKHEGFVDVAEAGDLGLSLLEPRLKLLCRHLKILDVGGRPIKQGHFAGFLVGHG